ncbi:hypothetical protein CF335_g5856, partial [Tilletia laevis]
MSALAGYDDLDGFIDDGDDEEWTNGADLDDDLSDDDTDEYEADEYEADEYEADEYDIDDESVVHSDLEDDAS